MNCHYCERSLTPDIRTKDHKKPRAAGGTWNPSNIVMCCRWCNTIKSARDYKTFKHSFRMFLLIEGHMDFYRNVSDWKQCKVFQSQYSRWFRANYTPF